MKRLKLLLVLLLSISLSACSEKAENLEQLYYPFSGDIYPYPHAEVDDPDDLKDQPWNIQNLKKLKALPIYTYQSLSIDEMMKQAEAIEALLGLESKSVSKDLMEDGNNFVILNSDTHHLFFYETGSYSLLMHKPIYVTKRSCSEDELKNEAFITELAENFYHQNLETLIPFNDPEIHYDTYRTPRNFIIATATFYERAEDEQTIQLNEAYNTLTLSFNDVGLAGINYHAPVNALVNDARLLSVDESIEQLKAFDDENLMPDISEIYDGRLFYSNAFDLRETIPVYQIYYTNNDEPDTYYEMLAPAVALDKEYLHAIKPEDTEEITVDEAVEPLKNPLQIPLPDDLTVIKQVDDTPLSYTALEGVGAAGGPSFFYTEKQIEMLKNSRWNLTNFTDEALFPIYHKASLTYAQMQAIADAICNYFDVTIQSSQYYEPIDFHSDDYIYQRADRGNHTQKILNIDTKKFYLTINEHGTIWLRIHLAYSEPSDKPYSKNPETGFSGYIGPQSDTVKNTAFYQREMMTVYEQLFKNLWQLDNPIADVQEASCSHINTNHEFYYWTKLYESRSDVSLSQQLFTASYQQLDFTFEEEGLSSVTYTPIFGTKVFDTPLLSVDDAISQFNKLSLLPPAIGPKPLEINEILTVTVGYNNGDYLYDTIPVYNIYYWQDEHIICSTIPAVTIDPDQYYIAPDIMFELHIDQAFR